MKIVKRKHYLQKIRDAFQFVPIVVLIGARQVGKTTIMDSYADESGKTVLRLNGQDPEVAALFDKMSILEEYLRVWLDPDI